MKVYRFFEVLVLVPLCLCSVNSVSAQQSGSAASVSRSRAIVSAAPTASAPASSTYYPSTTSYPTYNAPAPEFKIPEEVAVEEFVNYHKHRLPLPKWGQAVAMDTRWGNDEFSRSQREAVLQIGFTTAEVNERTDLRPLNLVLVIDKSGSMADDDKMSRVKEGLRTMLTRLRPNDLISIVTFDYRARVLLPSSRLGDGSAMRHAIDCLVPDGATNLHSGLMLGYAEARKHFQKDATNRVIILTDGIANQGVTNPSRIAADSSMYNKQGIDLSTIGVGLELNNDLLRTLARSGRGLYHFISDYKDIDKVFVNEVQSLISSVAKNVTVRIEYGPGLQLEKIYGYAPTNSNGSVSIVMDDMNNGLTQVIMAKFRTNSMNNAFPVKVRLSYYDVKRKCVVEEVQDLRLIPAESDSCELLADVEVKKNFTIAELADSLFEMSGFARRGNHSQAQNALDASVATAYRRYPNMEDQDIRFILDIVQGYQRDLKAYNEYNRKSSCGGCR
ncbi:MAG: VWA domain-containing protein [Pyrinomonadaceae bacterium]|nr:VWA domain-containing protein [Pyrinomonadaceae bacterium]